MARKKKPLSFSVGLGLDAEMIEKLEVIQENEFLDSKAQVIRKTLRFYFLYYKIPREKLDALL